LSKALEGITLAAVQLPREQRLSLANVLIERDDSNSEDGIDEAWDAEIPDGVRTVDKGRAAGIPYERVLTQIDRRLK